MSTAATMLEPRANPAAPGRYASAILGILDEFAKESMRLQQTALLNVLDDSHAERGRLDETRRALLNILDDASAEKSQFAHTQRAILNILDDSANEKLQLEATERAVLNILEDVDAERMERTRAEAQVRALNEDLEAHVAQRTAALAAANQELEAFAYSVSHDLRAPLRSIDGFSQALLEDYSTKLDDDGKDSLRRVRNAAQHMAALIDDMLKLSRATRGELNICPVDLSALAHSILAALRQQAPERSVEVSIAPGMVAQGDARLLGSVMENLLSNAWKFTGKKTGARIAVSAEAKDGELECRVRDNGAGFDMAYARNLFTPFQRLHLATEFPGNGIGLATVKRIVARMGGSVRAEGVPGEGATFCFTLPLAR